MDLGGSPPQPLGTGENELPIPDTTLWNFHLSGGYQSVMAARGAILRETPRDNRTVLKVARTEILESPLATISPLVSDVRRCLGEIAADSRAHIAVLNIELPGSGGVGGTVLATADGQGGFPAPSAEIDEGAQAATQDARSGSAPSSVNGAARESSGTPPPTKPQNSTATNDQSQPMTATIAPVTYGLETERMCELVITGSLESVEIAKVRLLVMLDELVSCFQSDCWHFLTSAFVERSTFRAMRHRLQATRDHRLAKTMHHSVHPGRDRDQYLLSYSPCRHPQSSSERYTAGDWVSKHGHGYYERTAHRYHVHADDWSNARYGYGRHERHGYGYGRSDGWRYGWDRYGRDEWRRLPTESLSAKQ